MKVLLLSQEYPPETAWGGIGTYAGIIAPALNRAGAEVHVLSVVPGQTSSEATIDGVRVIRRPLARPRGIGRITRLPLTWERLSLARAVGTEFRRLGSHFDVCETPEWHAEGLLLAVRRPLPLVVRSHSAASQVLPYLGPISADHRLASWCENVLLRRADIVTGPSAQVAAVARSVRLDSSRVHAIPYPVNPVDPAPRDRGSKLVLYLGRFEARKNPDVIIRAAAEVLRAVPDARFRFRGRDTGTPEGGSYVQQMRALVRLAGIDKAVEIEDRWADPSEVQDELSRADVFVFPSRWESFGMAAAEAAAMSCPVVASDLPAVGEIVDDGLTGRLLPADDVSAWASALTELLSAPERARAMGRAGARRMVSRCHPDRIAALTLGAYDDAISIAHRARPSA